MSTTGDDMQALLVDWYGDSAQSAYQTLADSESWESAVTLLGFGYDRALLRALVDGVIESRRRLACEESA